MDKTVDHDNLNKVRLNIVLKGFITKKDIENFIPCGYQKAKKVYTEIEQQLALENKKISPFGIHIDSFLKYIGLSEKQIRQYAELEESFKDRS